MSYDPFSIAPLPLVELDNPQLPRHGAFMARNDFCTKKFQKGTECTEFYRSLAGRVNGGAVIQCPFGFACHPFVVAGRKVAFTGIVPFPRLGGENERERAKQYSFTKIDQNTVTRLAAAMATAEKARIDSITEALKVYPSALHEIRKYNRTVKQEAERLCMKESPGDPDQADEALVRIMKSSELMTFQFEVLDLIANETLINLPRKTESELYKVLHKCVRIYQLAADLRKLHITIQGDSPRAIVCDKTFPIIPTVLIENAIKYAIPQTTIEVRIRQAAPKKCELAVINFAPRVASLPDIFQKGVSGKQDGTGLGVGLYLAQLVARQHGSEIRLKRIPQGGDRDAYIFSLELATL